MWVFDQMIFDTINVGTFVLQLAILSIKRYYIECDGLLK